METDEICLTTDQVHVSDTKDFMTPPLRGEGDKAALIHQLTSTAAARLLRVLPFDSFKGTNSTEPVHFTADTKTEPSLS